MDVTRVTCTDCGADRPPAERDGSRTPFEECGGAGIATAMSGTVVAQVRASASYSVVASNGAVGKSHQLDAGVDGVSSAVQRNDAGAGQHAVKQALEAIHELEDCRRRGEWSSGSWSTQENELWLAHIAARNAAHHLSGELVALHGDTDADPSSEDRLRWELSAGTLAELQNSRGVGEFSRLLAGKPALKPLRTIAGLVRDSMPPTP